MVANMLYNALGVRLMPFNDRLNLLMTVLGVTNISLARALSVDASLVSRWRTGARVPARTSAHIKNMATYFAGQAKTDRQKTALCEIIGLPLDKRREEASLLTDSLFAWLTEELVPGTELVDRFIDKLDMFKRPRSCSPPVGERETPPAGIPLRAEVFYGIKGKQDGVIRFLSAVAAREKPCTLLLYSDESMEWLTEDQGFLARFVPLFTEIFARGNKIKIIHTISRNLSEMLAAIDFWLPFYMTGAIEPYYYPRYRKHVFRRTMFIAPGVASLTSITLSGREKSAANLFSADPNLLESLTSEFNEYLSMCRPLMRIFAGDNPLPGLADLVTEFEEQPGDCICLSNTLSTVTMPEELLCRLLSRASANSKAKEKMLSVHKARSKAFVDNLKHRRHVEIVTLPLPVEIMASNVPVESPDLFGTTALPYTAHDYRTHLENIIRFLKSYSNFNFFVYRRAPSQNMRLAVKDEVGVIVSKKDPPPAVFAFNQQNMTDAFYCYLEDIISRIPQKERDRQRVIESLAELAGKLTD